MRLTVFLSLLTIGLFSSTSAWADSADSYHITTIDAPDAFQTYANGINNKGEIVGLFYVTSTGLNGHAFLLRDGRLSTYFLSPSGTQFNGINDEGRIVGLNAGGVLFYRGHITPISVPGTVQTEPVGINDLGQIVGWTATETESESFLLSHGNYSDFNVNGYANGINNAGHIVGECYGPHGCLWLNGVNEAATIIDFPGGAGTYLQGINDFDEIVGWYSDTAGVTHGLISGPNGVTSFDVPGSMATQLSGINDRGELVGNYTDAAGTIHGFLATPIEREHDGTQPD